MEVHHHSHTSRKKWTHYFWEFLMLFLAVFCGFLAENKREHYIERHREKDYMRSMLEDMQTDTAELNDEIQFAWAQLKMTDTILDILHIRESTMENIDQLYVLHFSNRLVGPYFEDRTSSQLKNAGGLRLVHKRSVADSLSNYWHSIKLCETMTQLYEYQHKQVTELSVRLFNSKYVVSKGIWDFPVLKKAGAKLIRTDEESLAEYGNRATLKRTLLRMFIDRLEITRDKALGVMKIIQKEYHLK